MKKILLLLITIFLYIDVSDAQYLNVTFCAETDEVLPVKDANGNDQRHKGAMVLDYITVKRFGGSTAPLIYQLSREAGDPTFDNGTFLDDCFNNNINTNCNGCGTCTDPKIDGGAEGSLSTKFEKGVRVRGLNENLRFESTGKFNQVCFTTKNIDLTNYKKNSLSIEVGWEGLEEDGFSAKNILIYYTFNAGVRKWLKIINSSSAVLGKQSTKLSKTTPVPETGGNGGGCANAFNFKINDFNNQTSGVQFPVKLKSDIGGSQSYDITYKNNSYDYDCEFVLPTNTADYYFEPKFNQDSWRDLSTRDLVVLQNQLLGKKIFSKNEMKIAADANNSGTISTRDISAIRQIILGALLQFKSVESYRFWNADQIFSSNPDPLLVPTLEETIPLDDVLDKSVSGDFNVVKMGDLTTLENLQGVKTRNDNLLKLVTDNITLKAFETTDILFKLNGTDINAIQALQGAFKSSNNSCIINSIEIEGIDNLFTNYKSSTDARFLWYSSEHIKTNEFPLIRLSITPINDIELKDAISWNNEVMEGLYTDQFIQEGKIEIRINDAHGNATSNDLTIMPNPVQNGLLHFYTNSSRKINQVKIISNTGQELSRYTIDFVNSQDSHHRLQLDQGIPFGCHFIIVIYDDYTFSKEKFIYNK